MAPRRSPILAVTLAAVTMLALLGGGAYLGGHPESLPRPLRDLLVSERVRTTQAAIDIIHDDYYRKVPHGRLVDQGLTGAVNSLHDRFSSYLDPRAYRRFLDISQGEFSGIGTEVVQEPRGLRVAKVFADSPAARAGIRAGDVFLAVNGRSIAGQPSRISTLLIQGKPGTPVRLTILSGSHRRVVRLIRARVMAPSVESRLRTVGGRKLGLDAVSSFTSGVHGELRQAVEEQRTRGARGILLDLRDNPGGLLDEAVLVSSLFIAKGPIVSIDGRTRPRHVYSAIGGAIPGRFPVVVLVNRETASAAEIVTAALQERRGAKVVGTRTFGKGVFQEVRELPNGGALDITVGEYFTPSGRNLGGGGVREGAGIAPNVASPSGPRGGDRALDLALRTLAVEAR